MCSGTPCILRATWVGPERASTISKGHQAAAAASYRLQALQQITRQIRWWACGRGGVEPPTFRFSAGSNGHVASPLAVRGVAEVLAVQVASREQAACGGRATSVPQRARNHGHQRSLTGAANDLRPGHAQVAAERETNS